MNAAIRRAQWQDAWSYSDQVLKENSEDPEAISAVARVAYEIGRQDRAAELLVQACRTESFRNAGRVQQTLIAMIGVGQLFEAMEMLEEAVAKQPQQHDTRRVLFDLYMGSELRQRGIPHGKFLVRSRKFDLELLQSLSNTERRTQENAPLLEMTSRNPDDKRPLLGEAKLKFDQGELDASIEVLGQILDKHPDYLPAQALLARALASVGRFDELEQWAAAQDKQVETYVGYWLAVGDWARANQQSAAAARAYWEATRRDTDVMEAWSKLNTELRQVAMSRSELSEQTIQAVGQRASLLSMFNQQKQRFDRTGGISRAIAVDIVKTLQQLGRLWEAEAWAAIALNLPEDDSVDVDAVRSEVVSQLTKETPWQLTEDFPELRADLAFLPLPPIGKLADGDRSDVASLAGQSVTVDYLQLVNEANERGVRFFGRTADDLDQPGIMLYETLGCGGGTIDFDLDGWSDLYLVAAGGTPPAKNSSPNALMRNLDGSFINVTDSTSTGDRGFGQGVAVGDVNEDGFADLLVLNYGPNTLLINNGDGTFSDHSHRLPGNDDRWSTAAAIADLDGDSLNDVVIINYCATLDPVTVDCPMKDSDISRSCSPMKFAAEPDQFLQGSSAGRLMDRTEDWNASPSVVGRGLGIVAGAFDGDAGVDLFIANDMTNNHYWSRGGAGGAFQLAESAMLRGLGADDRSLAQGSMGIAAADLDVDGDIDFYVTNFDQEYNIFHTQRSPGVWQDTTAALQLNRPTLPLVGFGSEAVDLDHDGSLELVVSNGHVDMFSRADERSVYAHPMQIFQRNENGTYDSIAPEVPGEYLARSHVGRALWTIDANRDGKIDLAVTHQTEPTALLINHSRQRGNWIALQLVGTTSSRDAIGAKVKVRVGEQTWTGFQTSGDGYLCSNERILRFGMGEVDSPCDVEITWPDGKTETHSGLAPGKIWQIVQASAPSSLEMRFEANQPNRVSGGYRPRTGANAQTANPKIEY